MPNYAAVTGVRGLALKLTHSDGREVRFNKPATPQLLNPGLNTLDYNVTLVRTTGPLDPGPWWAVLNFNTFYF